MGSSRRNSYFALLKNHAKHLVGRPLSSIDWEDAARVTNNMLTCTACLERAQRAGRADLIARRDIHLRGTEPPWDGLCEDEDGISTHFVELKENSLTNYLGALRTAFAVAQFCGNGQRPRDRRCRPNLENPFETFVYPKYAARSRPYDYARALTHGEVRRVAELMPAHYRAAVIVCTYGMFRRSELLGLNRSNIAFPTTPDQMGQAEVTPTHVWIEGEMRAWGKTNGSVGTRIFLPAFATEALRDHMQEFRSAPNPEACDACRAGLGEHLDARRRIPHRRCDFADNAPVWLDLAEGGDPSPTTSAVRSSLTRSERRASMRRSSSRP